MKTAWALILTAVVTLGGATLLLAGISNEAIGNLRNNADPNTMAAYRDGLYHARLQAQRGEEPHLAVGRWQNAADRELFVAGYRQGFMDFYAAHPELKHRPEALRFESVNFADKSAGVAEKLLNRSQI
jgi:hypothetical protein